jgi:O-antigen ligase
MPLNQAISLLLILAVIATGFFYIGDPKIGIALLMLTSITCYFSVNRKTWHNYQFSLMMVVYLIWLCVVALFSSQSSISMMTLAVLTALPLMFLSATNISSFNVIWRILNKTLLLVGFSFAIWAIYQVSVEGKLAEGPLEDRNAFAALMNLIWFLAVIAFTKYLKEKNIKASAASGLCILIVSIALFATSSRAGIVAWLILQPLLIWCVYQFTQSKKITAIVPMIALIAYFFSAIPLNSDVSQRSFSLKQDKSTSARVLLWKSSAEIALDNPITGTGWGTFESIYPAYRYKEENTTKGLYTHNDYLQFAAEGGIPAALLLISILIGILLQIKKNLTSIRSDAQFESVVLLLAVLALFIHASLNFIFYYAFMNAIAGLYLARVALLTEKPKTLSLTNLHLFRPYARRVVAGFIILLFAMPFITRQFAMSTLSNSQSGLKALNKVFPDLSAPAIAHFINAIYPKELISQNYALLEIENTLLNSNFNDETHFDIKKQYLLEAIAKFDYVRSQTANNPELGVREAKILIKYHNFFDTGFAFAKANEVLDANIKAIPFDPDSYIMQSRLELAQGNHSKAMRILKSAEQKMIYQLDHRLVYVEILRQQSDSSLFEELDTLEKEIRLVSGYLETDNRHLIPPKFGPNLDQKLKAIEQKIIQKN